MKKIVTFAVIAVVGLMVINSSRVKVMTARVKNFINDQESIDYQIERASIIVNDLDVPIDKCRKNEAVQRNQAEEIDRKIKTYKENLSEQDETILAIREALNTDKPTYEFSGKTYTRLEVESDLARKFSRRNSLKGTIEGLEDLYAAKIQAADAMLARTQSLMNKQNELHISIEKMVAKKELLDTLRVTEGVELDETVLAEVDKILQDVGSKLDVAEQLAMANVDEIKIEEGTEDLLAMIDAEFSN